MVFPNPPTGVSEERNDEGNIEGNLDGTDELPGRRAIECGVSAVSPYIADFLQRLEIDTRGEY